VQRVIPNAEKLSVCEVTTNGSNRLQIICGAPNVRGGSQGRGGHAGCSSAGRHHHQARHAARPRIPWHVVLGARIGLRR
jgi:hypothetical protein